MANLPIIRRIPYFLPPNFCFQTDRTQHTRKDMSKNGSEPWKSDPIHAALFRPQESPRAPMEFLSRSWSVSALEVSEALAPAQRFLSKSLSGVNNGVDGGGGGSGGSIPLAGEIEENATLSRNQFSFASSETSQMVMECIMSQSQEVSSLTSGRHSHSSGPQNGTQSCGSLTESPPVSSSEIDDTKYNRSTNPSNTQFRATAIGGTAASGGSKTMGRWLKDRKEKKKEEARAQNAQLHAAVSVAGVAAAVAAIAAAMASSSSVGKDEQMAKTSMAVASAATLVAAQCVENAETMGAEREHLASVVSSAVNVRSAGDIMTLTAGAATALRGAATMKARVLKEVWNIAAVIPVDKGMRIGSNDRNSNSSSSLSGELVPEENSLGICCRELLAKGGELLKRTRKGDLHWKIVSVYINRTNQVMLKMKSRHVAGTITKKKKNVVMEVIKDMPAWPGRHLLEGGENFRYFSLKTILRGVVEFECRNQREHDIWTQGVSRLLSIAAENNNRHRT